MDNLAHTLVGAALGEAGLKQKTGLGMATLMIAANLPDIDVLGFLVGENLAWRRGWTHGPLALILLPPLLALAIFAFDGWQTRRGRRPAARPPVRFGWLLALAYVGALSHPLLDFLNSYGIRCLMPFSERWFYGDALFIIDIWVWIALALGIYISRRRERHRYAHSRGPAASALIAVAIYASAMGLASHVAETLVTREIVARGLPAPREVVAGPVPVDPFRRDIVVAAGDAYGFGHVRWAPRPVITLPSEQVPNNMGDPAIAKAAARDKKVADFLYWSRLPFAEIVRSQGRTHVTIGDARYNRAPRGRFSVETVLPE